MNEKDKKQLEQLLYACRGIFSQFSIIEIDQLIDCVKDSYDMKEETLKRITEYFGENPDKNTVDTFEVVLNTRKKLLQKLVNIQKDLSKDIGINLDDKDKRVEEILNS